MIQSHLGEVYAIITAVFWTFTALAFTSAGKKIGSLPVNFWRLIVGLSFLFIWCFFTLDNVLPINVPLNSWFWLFTSGFIGVFVGDLFLFKSFTITGPRVALLMMTLSPPMAGGLSYLFLNETMSSMAIVAMTMGLFGIGLVIFSKKEQTIGEVKKRKIGLRYSSKGLFYSFIGAVCQASGLVMSKAGLNDNVSPFHATQIRLFAGIFGFVILITYLKRWKPVLSSVKNHSAFATLSLGAFFGPFLGISFSMLAITYANPGIVQTITSVNPILIIPFSVFLFKEKVKITEIIGAVIAVIGVSLFFL